MRARPPDRPNQSVFSEVLHAGASRVRIDASPLAQPKWRPSDDCPLRDPSLQARPSGGRAAARAGKASVTCSPRRGVDQAVEVGTRLRRLGHDVAVHLSARTIRDAGHLDRTLEVMADADITDAFVIGGDNGDPQARIPSAGELLALIGERLRAPAHDRDRRYPEGHPQIESRRWPSVLEDERASSPLHDDPDVLRPRCACCGGSANPGSTGCSCPSASGCRARSIAAGCSRSRCGSASARRWRSSASSAAAGAAAPLNLDCGQALRRARAGVEDPH